MTTIGELLRDGARCDRSGPRWRETLEFHAANPWVYDRLAQMCHRLRERGFAQYSTRTLIAVLRFEADLKSTGQAVRVDGDEREVKLNDHHTAYYARMLIESYPHLWDFFELRAAEGDPVAPPKAGFHSQTCPKASDHSQACTCHLRGNYPPALDGNQATLGI